jgi:hypothetical protein
MKAAFGFGVLLLAAVPVASWAGEAEDRLAQAVRGNDNAAVKSLLAGGADPMRAWPTSRPSWTGRLTGRMTKR